MPSTAIFVHQWQLSSSSAFAAAHGRSGMEDFWYGNETHKICQPVQIHLLLVPTAESRIGVCGLQGVGVNFRILRGILPSRE